MEERIMSKEIGKHVSKTKNWLHVTEEISKLS